jgi:copper chaperone CopZ
MLCQSEHSLCVNLLLMKCIFLALFLAISLVTASPLDASESVNSAQATSPVGGGESGTTIEIKVKGSMCPACLKRLETTLSLVPGVRSVHLASDNLVQKSKTDSLKESKRRHYALYAVTFDPSQTTKEEIEKAVRQRDFVISSVRFLGR